MVDFPRSYHTIFGWPCYAKFMVIPNYTYLKLKMLGPNNVITVGSTFLHAYTCDREHFELTTAIINSSEVLGLRELSTPTVPDYNKPTSSMAFCPLEQTKAVGIDPTDPTKRCGSGPSSQPNRNASSSTSYALIMMSSHGSHLTCRAYRWMLPSTHYASS